MFVPAPALVEFRSPLLPLLFLPPPLLAVRLLVPLMPVGIWRLTLRRMDLERDRDRDRSREQSFAFSSSMDLDLDLDLLLLLPVCLLWLVDGVLLVVVHGGGVLDIDVDFDDGGDDNSNDGGGSY